MKHKDHLGIVPVHYTGEEIEAEATTELETEQEAISFFATVRMRLLNVNKWHAFAGYVSAKFQLVSENGREEQGLASKGAYIRIDIPGPGSSEGHGYDWVHIEDLKEIKEDGMDAVGFRVRPAPNPGGDPEHVAHFYNEAGTSSFMITRQGKMVTSSIIDRNLKPNNDTHSVADKLRHTVVGIGAISAFSKIQWQNLAEGLVDLKD